MCRCAVAVIFTTSRGNPLRDSAPTIVSGRNLLVTSYSRLVLHSFLWQGGAQAAGQAVTWLATIADFVDRCIFPVVASIAMTVVLLSLGEALDPLDTSAARLTILVASGVTMYAAFVLVFQRGTVRELVAVAKS